MAANRAAWSANIVGSAQGQTHALACIAFDIATNKHHERMQLYMPLCAHPCVPSRMRVRAHARAHVGACTGGARASACACMRASVSARACFGGCVCSHVQMVQVFSCCYGTCRMHSLEHPSPSDVRVHLLLCPVNAVLMQGCAQRLRTSASTDSAPWA